MSGHQRGSEAIKCSISCGGVAWIYRGANKDNGLLPILCSFDENGILYLKPLSKACEEDKNMQENCMGAEYSFYLEAPPPPNSKGINSKKRTKRQRLESVELVGKPTSALLLRYENCDRIYAAAMPGSTLEEIHALSSSAEKKKDLRPRRLQIYPYTSSHSTTISSFCLVKTTAKINMPNSSSQNRGKWGEYLLAVGESDGSLSMWPLLLSSLPPITSADAGDNSIEEYRIRKGTKPLRRPLIRIPKAHSGGSVTVLLGLYNAVASGGKDQKIRIWSFEIETMQYECAQVLDIEASVVSALYEVLIAGSGEGMLFLWNMNEMKLEGVVAGAEERVMSLAASPDGRAFAAGYLDGKVTLHSATESPNFSEIGRHEVKGAAIKCAWIVNDHHGGDEYGNDDDYQTTFTVWSSDGSHLLWKKQQQQQASDDSHVAPRTRSLYPETDQGRGGRGEGRGEHLKAADATTTSSSTTITTSISNPTTTATTTPRRGKNGAQQQPAAARYRTTSCPNGEMEQACLKTWEKNFLRLLPPKQKIIGNNSKTRGGVQRRVEKKIEDEIRKNPGSAAKRALELGLKDKKYQYHKFSSVEVDVKAERFQRKKKTIPKQISKEWLESLKDRPSVFDYYGSDPHRESQYLPALTPDCEEVISEVLDQAASQTTVRDK
eukprot:jgi/Bigna1/72641/fgenesh1_pg.20_\